MKNKAIRILANKLFFDLIKYYFENDFVREEMHLSQVTKEILDISQLRLNLATLYADGYSEKKMWITSEIE